MRTAVLVLNYILVGVLALNFVALPGKSAEEAAISILGIVMLTPVVVVNLVYAHSQREK